MPGNLRSRVIRLAYSQPSLRAYLLPMLKQASVYITPVALRLWIKGDSWAMNTLRDRLEGRLHSEALRMFEQNDWRPPPPPMLTRGKGRKKDVPPEPPPQPPPKIDITPETVVARTLAKITGILDDLDAGSFGEWFEDYLADSVNTLSRIHHAVGVWRGHTDLRDGKLMWDGTLMGEQLDEDTEVPEDVDTDKIEAAIRKLGGKVTWGRWHIDFIRTYGAYGDHYSVYDFKVVWDLPEADIVGKLFKDNLLRMAEEAIQKAKD